MCLHEAFNWGCKQGLTNLCVLAAAACDERAVFSVHGNSHFPGGALAQVLAVVHAHAQVRRAAQIYDSSLAGHGQLSDIRKCHTALMNLV